ncbi:hypothetical protein QBC33DRAFT_322736 [Phialemonium atrogriseum]|uniref:Uncharacterized protein n=1 Tax=Phialemonium atrogriseum TaxID=1093897 RepID=A0AAJ0FJ31_9PEZI|nr:uncharacterized protein QBC33DRAFT_322736 [Phialemonium atrogriseum]KAK1769482.1 hypothetical protein QBC33DRAFT_322736 [Phialemonium atrogriseum]
MGGWFGWEILYGRQKRERRRKTVWGEDQTALFTMGRLIEGLPVLAPASLFWHVPSLCHNKKNGPASGAPAPKKWPADWIVCDLGSDSNTHTAAQGTVTWAYCTTPRCGLLLCTYPSPPFPKRPAPGFRPANINSFLPTLWRNSHFPFQTSPSSTLLTRSSLFHQVEYLLAGLAYGKQFPMKPTRATRYQILFISSKSKLKLVTRGSRTISSRSLPNNSSLAKHLLCYFVQTRFLHSSPVSSLETP